MEPRTYIDDFSAGYMQRVMHRFPRLGARDPWINSQQFLLERKQFTGMDFSEPALQYRANTATAEVAAGPSSESAEVRAA